MRPLLDVHPDRLRAWLPRAPALASLLPAHPDLLDQGVRLLDRVEKARDLHSHAGPIEDLTLDPGQREVVQLDLPMLDPQPGVSRNDGAGAGARLVDEPRGLEQRGHAAGVVVRARRVVVHEQRPIRAGSVARPRELSC